MLVAHWEQLQATSSSSRAAAAAADDGEEGEEASPFAVFAEQLRQGWWQQQPDGGRKKNEGRQSSGAGAGRGAGETQSSGGNDARDGDGDSTGSSSNLRDRVFHAVLPHDWQVEAPEPPGLACTLFRYQRRCLAWLKWRESLGLRGGSSSAGDGGDSVKLETEAAAAAAAAAGTLELALPDPDSTKAVLPACSLLWQPLALPSGQRAWHNLLEGGVRLQPVEPPLAEVSGGALCDEMGLGEWLVGVLVGLKGEYGWAVAARRPA